MTDPARLPRSSVIRHQPQLMRDEQAKADAIIEYAKKVKDWPLLIEAIELKIAQQQEFVAWWDATVGTRHALNRHSLDNADLHSLARTEAERLTGILQHQVSRWRTRLKDRERYRERMIQAASRAAELRAATNHRAIGTGDNEWFTPAEYIAAVRLVLDDIDLDPATHPIAQETVNAARYFTRDDDSLEQEWHGRIWLNPPYGRGEIGLFINKLVGEILLGHVSAAVLLTHSYTDTEWFHNAVSVSQALCFTKGRVKFIDDTGQTCAPTQGQVFFYYGPDSDIFDQVFSAFGLVAIPSRRPQ